MGLPNERAIAVVV